MSLIKKKDVKDHLAARRRKEVPPRLPGRQADGTGFSGVESGRVAPGKDQPIANPTKQSSPNVLEVPAFVDTSSSSETFAPSVVRGAQA